jgi:hypothetical protein
VGKFTGYRLLPGGTTFLKPVVAIMNVSRETSGIPLLLHLGKDTMEQIDNVTYDITRDVTGKTTLIAKAELTHFSGVVITDEDFFTVGVKEGPHSYPLYTDIPFEFTIVPREQPYKLSEHIIAAPGGSSESKTIISELAIAEETRYQVNVRERESKFWERGSRIHPEVILPPRDLARNETYRVTETLRCSKEGVADFSSDTIKISFIRSHASKTIYLFNKVQNFSTSSRTIFTHYSVGYLCTEALGEQPQVNTVTSAGTPAPARTNKAVVTPSPSTKPSGGMITVCGLPGGPACPKH